MMSHSTTMKNLFNLFKDKWSKRDYLLERGLRSSNIKYSKSYKDNTQLTTLQKKALIGLLLGDVHASRIKAHHNTRLSFDQSKEHHSDYLNYLYELFEPFVGTEPKSTQRKPDKRTGQVYDSMVFKTLAFPCFNEFYELFYSEGKKIISSNISDYLTDVGFAFWIMDDRGKTTNGELLLHTNSYSMEEIELLISVLKNNFDVEGRLRRKITNQWGIIIPKRELDKVRKLTSTYIHDSMKYKIEG